MDLRFLAKRLFGDHFIGNNDEMLCQLFEFTYLAGVGNEMSEKANIAVIN